MWRRTYLLLLFIRIYFVLSPSYLHPDENFQGPEVFAGRVLSYPSKLTWEFTNSNPIRSVFPLWPVYVVPMSLLKWFYGEMDMGNPPPALVYYILRGTMFLLSFVLEDWAIHELISSPHQRRVTLVLVASSYVTWTYQTHTFSNALETLLVFWGLVLIRRIVADKNRSSFLSTAELSFIAVVGTFNRITFPAFLLIPGLQLLPHFWRKPLSLLSLIGFGLFFSLAAILIDTTFFTSPKSVSDALHAPVITPINNLVYNSDSSNLALHGLHSRFQHFLVNLPQLLGPAYVVMFLSLFKQPFTIPFWMKNMRFVSAVSAILILSIFPHQETRFLVPAVPLLLSCIQLPRSRSVLALWVVFNATLGLLMGVYHQGGVIPTQLAIPSIVSENAVSPLAHSSWTDDSNSQRTATVFWWKTYPPPTWLVGDNNNNYNNQTLKIDTVDLMGIKGPEMISELNKLIPPCPNRLAPQDPLTSSIPENPSEDGSSSVFLLVAPTSATFLDQYTNANLASSDSSDSSSPSPSFLLRGLWVYKRHVNLDDLDFGSDGVLPTLRRVVRRRGLGVWAVSRRGCMS